MRRALPSLLLLSAFASTPALAAPPSSPAEEEPRAMAQRGRAAYDAGDLATGCPLLGEAYRRDDTLLGVGFAFADCREREGKLVEAHDLFSGVARKASARGEERAVEAQQRADAIAARLPAIALDVKDAGADARVTLDGVELARDTWATPRLVEPGPHEVILEAGGRRVVRALTDLPVGQATRIELARPAAPVATRGPTPAPEEPAPSSFPWKTVGLVGAGTGVAVLGTGVVLGLVAKGNYDEVESDCDASGCTADAAATRTDARSLAHVGTALFIGGAVLGAAGAALFVFGPESSPSATAVVGPGTMSLQGSF